jgi:hypothetical protein
LANSFLSTWDEHDRPEFVVKELQFDWTKFYKKHNVMLRGFTKTKSDPNAVHGFRIQRHKGEIMLHWKDVPSDRVPWRGFENRKDGPGFKILRSRPTGVPGVVEPAQIKPKIVRNIFTDAIRSALDDEGQVESFEWLRTVVENRGKMTVNRIVQEPVAGELGSLVEIGAAPRVAIVRLVSEVPTEEEFWSIPANVTQTATPSQFERPLPNVTFARRSDQVAHYNDHGLTVPAVVPKPAPKKKRGRPKKASKKPKKSSKKRGRPKNAADPAAVVANPGESAPVVGGTLLSLPLPPVGEPSGAKPGAESNTGKRNAAVPPASVVGEPLLSLPLPPVSSTKKRARKQSGPVHPGLAGEAPEFDPSLNFVEEKYHVQPQSAQVGHFAVFHSLYPGDVVGLGVGKIVGCPRPDADGYLVVEVLPLTPRTLCTNKATLNSRWSLPNAKTPLESPWLSSAVTVFPALNRGWLPVWVRELIRLQSFYNDMQ